MRHSLKFKAASLEILLLALLLHPISGVSRQTTFPAPPADRNLIYLVNNEGALTPLAFETATTPLHVDQIAGSNKRSYVEFKGRAADAATLSSKPAFYLFVPDRADPHPPFIVKLTPRGETRRVTVMAQKGLSGFAVDSEAIVKPSYRVLARDGGMLYMEIRPRESLEPGDYAIIGSDLQRVVSFRVASSVP